jgi:hypothetical protein
MDDLPFGFDKSKPLIATVKIRLLFYYKNPCPLCAFAQFVFVLLCPSLLSALHHSVYRFVVDSSIQKGYGPFDV